MRRSGRLRRRGSLQPKASLRRGGRLARRTPLRRTPFSPASEEQRTKVAGQACICCGGRPVDPAHLVPRSLGGCDEADCCVALCRRCHRAFDRGGLDLLPHLEPSHRRELQHALGHISLLRLIERATGERWRPIDHEAVLERGRTGRLRELQKELPGTRLECVGGPDDAIRLDLDGGAHILVTDDIGEWVIGFYAAPRSEGVTLRLPAQTCETPRVTGGRCGRDQHTEEDVRMNAMSDDPGAIPEGYKWCDHCNGYGSSLKDANDRCAKCNGSGLVAADRSGEAAAAPTNGADKRRPTRPS